LLSKRDGYFGRGREFVEKVLSCSGAGPDSSKWRPELVSSVEQYGGAPAIATLVKAAALDTPLPETELADTGEPHPFRDEQYATYAKWLALPRYAPFSCLRGLNGASPPCRLQ